MNEDELDFEESEEFSEDNYADDSDDEDVSLDISILEKEARDIVRDYTSTLSRELKLGKFSSVRVYFVCIDLTTVIRNLLHASNDSE